MKSLFNQDVKISRVLVAFLLLALGFMVLTYINTPISFFIILLSGLIGSWLLFGLYGIKKIFSRPKKGSFKFIVLSVVVAFIISISTGLMSTFMLNQPVLVNPIKEQFSGSLLNSFILLFKTLFMLAGEEILVTLPLIIIVSLSTHKTNISKSKAVVIATILTAIIFGAIHLPTYQWSLFQCFISVALTRIPFTIISLKSDSMISGIVGHVAFDWILFSGMIISQL